MGVQFHDNRQPISRCVQILILKKSLLTLSAAAAFALVNGAPVAAEQPDQTETLCNLVQDSAAVVEIGKKAAPKKEVEKVSFS